MKSPRSPAARRAMQLRMDRHSSTGTRGLPKKNGAGGKTVWGSAMDQAPVAALDKKDPNYDSDNDMMLPDFVLTPPSLNVPAAPTEPKKPVSSATPASANTSPNNSATLPSPEASD